MHKTILTFILAMTALAIVSASTAYAGEPTAQITLDLNVGSYHTQAWARDALNQRNPGVGATYI